MAIFDILIDAYSHELKRQVNDINVMINNHFLTSISDFPNMDDEQRLYNGIEVRANGNLIGNISNWEPSGNRERVTIPNFEITSNPTVRLSDIRERRFPSLVFDEVREEIIERLKSKQVNGYWVEPENQDGRKECVFCDETLIEINECWVCPHCDKK